MSVSTHVLDTMRGGPAAGLEVRLSRVEPDGDLTRIGESQTDADGRIRQFTDDDLEPGDYQLRFDTYPYFQRSGLAAFYPEVSVVFTFEGGHVHIPLLLSAFGYTTYKGT